MFNSSQSKDLFSETEFIRTLRDKGGFYDDLDIDSALLRQAEDEEDASVYQLN